MLLIELLELIELILEMELGELLELLLDIELIELGELKLLIEGRLGIEKLLLELVETLAGINALTFADVELAPSGANTAIAIEGTLEDDTEPLPALEPIVETT
jgi:hypothetical protein